jgi:hypothetical protein
MIANKLSSPFLAIIPWSDFTVTVLMKAAANSFTVGESALVFPRHCIMSHEISQVLEL